jgi:hypothetical protein
VGLVNRNERTIDESNGETLYAVASSDKRTCTSKVSSGSGCKSRTDIMLGLWWAERKFLQVSPRIFDAEKKQKAH